MNLYNLHKEYKEKKVNIKHLRDKIHLLKTRLEPNAVNIKDISVSGNPKRDDIADIMDKIMEHEAEIKKLLEEINIYKNTLADLEAIFKEYNDTYKMIYLEYYVKQYSAEKIGLRYNYSRAQVYRIINKIDDELSDENMRQNETRSLI